MFYVTDAKRTLVRFDMANFMEFLEDEETYDVVSSYFIKEVRKLSLGGEYIVLKEAHRPDLLSYNIYGSTQYWWIIMLYNDIIDFTTIELGMTLKYPSPSGIENLYFRLKSIASTILEQPISVF